MNTVRRRRALTSVLTAMLATALAACGSSSQSSSTKSASTPASTPAAKSGPGVGKPPVTIGEKDFTEQSILGSLYQQALAAKGYSIAVKGHIGSTELTYKALTSGQIDMYPEYTGTFLTAIAGQTAPPKSAAQAYAQAKAFAQKHGFTLLRETPFFDSDAIGAVKAYAQKNHLSTIADLKRLGPSLKLGGPPEFQTREQGLVGIKRAYGINPTFRPVTIGLLYKALDGSQVDVSDVFTTDAELTSGKYTVLSDPKHVFGFQNVAPIVKLSVLAAEGPEFQQTIDKVNALMTIPAIQKMMAAVKLDQQPAEKVARQFLAANGLA